MIALGPLHAPEAAAAAGHAQTAGPVGNPLYDVLPGHEIAIVAVLILPLIAWWLRLRARDGSLRAGRLVAGYDGLLPLDRMAVWAMAASAAVHLALATGHGGPGIGLAFLLQASLLGVAIRSALVGGRWRWLGGLVLAGSIAAYGLALSAGDLPDQVGLATKLIEIGGLAAIARGASTTHRLARPAVSVMVIGLTIATATAGWVGAVRAANGGVTGHGHAPVGGEAAGYPAPGSVMPGGIASDPSPAQAEAAGALHAALVAATAQYADPARAAADGYDIEGIHGTDFHAGNPAYESDGRVLDPERPEHLIYGQTQDGAVLLGAMFTVPYGQTGPMIGGPLTVWHAHEHVCLGLLPPGLTGLLSPLGGCPFGSVDLPLTNEMIHAWVVDGAPQAWGDLDEAWRVAYLQRTAPSR